MPKIWAKTANFDSISVGDQLPILVKSETEQTIKDFATVIFPAEVDPTATPEPHEVSSQEAVASSSSALVAYVGELVEKGFPVINIMAQGSNLTLEVVRPVNPEDTLILSGRVTGKREEKGRGVVECEVIIENQDGERVALVQASVFW